MDVFARQLIVFLTVATTLLAGTACACASRAGVGPKIADGQHTARPCCRSAPDRGTSEASTGRPGTPSHRDTCPLPDHGSHPCPHCGGAAAPAEAAQATVSPLPHFPAFLSVQADLGRTIAPPYPGSPAVRNGRSPYPVPPTLLSLGCCLNA